MEGLIPVRQLTSRLHQGFPDHLLGLFLAVADLGSPQYGPRCGMLEPGNSLTPEKLLEPVRGCRGIRSHKLLGVMDRDRLVARSQDEFRESGDVLQRQVLARALLGDLGEDLGVHPGKVSHTHIEARRQ